MALVRNCDICQKTPAVPISGQIGKSIDASGSPDTDMASIDLCFVHLAERLSEALKLMSDSNRERVLSVKGKP